MSVLLGLADRLRLAKLCFITDLRFSQDDFMKLLADVYSSGVDMVQIRDTKAPYERQVAAIELAGQVARQRGKIAVLGHNLKAGQEAQTSGLHLSVTDPDASSVRQQLPNWSLIGKSVHSRHELRCQIEKADADYLFVSPVFIGNSNTLGLVSYASEKLPVGPNITPWFATGSINLSNINQVLDAGARRIGVSGAILNSTDPKETAKALADEINKRWQEEKLHP